MLKLTLDYIGIKLDSKEGKRRLERTLCKIKEQDNRHSITENTRKVIAAAAIMWPIALWAVFTGKKDKIWEMIFSIAWTVNEDIHQKSYWKIVTDSRFDWKSKN